MLLLRFLTSVLACLAAGAVLVACGGGEKKSSGAKPAQAAKPAKPEVLTFKTTGNGKSTKIDGPSTAKSGLVKLRFTNSAEGEHSAQVLSIGEGHSIQEGLTAGSSWGEKGTPLPGWIKFHGGIGSLEPGETESVTLALKPGKYIAVDIEAESDGAVKEFEVKGKKGQLPKAKGGTITASDYKFKGSKLTAGSNELLLKNAGKEPHHLLAAPIKEGKTLEDVQKFFTDEEGDAPIDEKRAFNTAILDGGTEQLVEVDLDAGRYVMFCFIPDRKGGPPHAFKGMITEVPVQ